MRDCPNCGAHVDGLRCSGCGFSEAGAGPVADPNRFLCEHVDRGLRCANAGTLTSNTVGPAGGKGAHPGPWFCARHFKPLRDGAQDPNGAERIAEIAARYRPKPVDFEAQAERIAIQSEGETV